jgi:hypothetical protein
MKTLKFYALMGAFALAMIFVSCSKDDDDTSVYPAVNNLSDAEKAGLIEMVEVEKLHRDVYQLMNIQSPCDLFAELCNCDGDFMEQLASKIKKYKLENPLNGYASGSYANKKYQNTYDAYMNIPDPNLMKILEFASDMEKQAISVVENQVELAQSEEMKVLFSNILEQSRCQLQFINDKLNHREPVEHPGNPSTEF